MPIVAENNKIIHLPIDVQKYFYEDLSAKRSKIFPNKIGVFSRQLENLGIETLPVAYAHNSVAAGLHISPFDRKYDEGNIFDALTFAPDFYPIASNAVYVKSNNNAFNGDNILAREVKKMGVKTILITGMNTTACVCDSIVGAFNKCSENVCIHIVYDLLADASSTPVKPDGVPLRHKAALERIIAIDDENMLSSPRVRMVTAAEVLEEYSHQDILSSPRVSSVTSVEVSELNSHRPLHTPKKTLTLWQKIRETLDL